jgi:non-reducing end alpha-L-arabinofuranosidase
MADLENGLFSGEQIKENPNDPTVTYRFLTAVVKGKAGQWAIRGGNADGGKLSTYYNGSRPDAAGYNPMSKEGAIILGIGGDNSLGGQGTFYEGVMTKGYPSDLTENAVQANVASASYTALSLVSGPAVKVGSTITFQPTTTGYTDRLLAHTGATVNTQVVTSSDTAAQWEVRTGLSSAGASGGCVSFESVDTPGSFIRHFNFVLQLQANDGTKQFGEDATFCPQTPISGKSGANSVRAWGYPTRFFRHFENVGYIASNGGPEAFDAQAGFNDDATWIISSV